MELLSVINKKNARSTPTPGTLLYDGKSLCTLSCRNIVAFTTITELDDTRGKTWGSHVYICDINIPWHVHKVLTNKFAITALEWDLSGDKLVVADAVGNVQLWMFKDHILNDWILIGSAKFNGENLIHVAWFHNGKKISLVAGNKDSVHYSEKFNHSLFNPSVKQFGGRAAEGVLVISTTGMVGAVMLTKDISNSVTSATESLGSTRNLITAVDICYGKNGQFLVAVSCGNMNMPIRCYRVLVRKNDDKCNITSQAWPGFFLQGVSGKENIPFHVSHLKFLVREAADSLIVTANTETEGFVEIWELREKPQQIHKIFQPKLTEPYKTVVWQHQNQYRFYSPITTLTTTKLSITAMPPTSYILLALADSSIHCLNDCLKEVALSSLNMPWRQDEQCSKLSKQSVTICHMDTSWLGCAFVVSDTRGSLYLYKFIPEGGKVSGPISLNHACTLLEYCLVSGLDWLDLLFCLRSSMIETLCERLDASFNRQTIAVQQYHLMQFLCIKTSLYRMLATGQNKAADLSSLMMVHSIATAFRFLLRPSDLISHDKGPAETLSSAINDNNITDVDKVLLHIDAKEFTVEPTTLQSLQQLIQWVADLALNILARLPEQRTQIKTSGYELLRDQKALNTIRELLVIIRVWGLLKTTCLPVFMSTSDNLDALALVFRLLSKLVLSNGEASNDDGLIDECCLLPNQIMIPQLYQLNSITAIATPVLFYQSLPMQFEYGTEPENLNFVPDLNQVEGCMHSGQVVDTIRHLYLGKQPVFLKQCTRCGGKAQIQNMTRTVAIRAWDQRWAQSCVCGGIWRMPKVPSNYSNN